MEKPTIYTLDQKQRIIGLDGPWDEFYQENGGAGLSFTEIEGQSIFRYVTGDHTRMWLQSIIQLVMAGGKPVERPYRCDSPEMRRYMQMRVVPAGPGTMTFEHHLLSMEPREKTVDIHYGGVFTRKDLRMRCSVCGRIRLEGRWLEPELGVSGNGNKVMVTYTVCESCSEAVPDLFSVPKS